VQDRYTDTKPRTQIYRHQATHATCALYTHTHTHTHTPLAPFIYIYVYICIYIYVYICINTHTHTHTHTQTHTCRADKQTAPQLMRHSLMRHSRRSRVPRALTDTQAYSNYGFFWYLFGSACLARSKSRRRARFIRHSKRLMRHSSRALARHAGLLTWRARRTVVILFGSNLLLFFLLFPLLFLVVFYCPFFLAVILFGGPLEEQTASVQDRSVEDRRMSVEDRRMTLECHLLVVSAPT
jgi:hypothetical protein